MSFSISAVVNVAEKSSRRSGSVLYLTNGAPAAELPSRRGAARETPALSEHEGLRHQLCEPGDHRVDRELHDPGLVPSPTWWTVGPIASRTGSTRSSVSVHPRR